MFLEECASGDGSGATFGAGPGRPLAKQECLFKKSPLPTPAKSTESSAKLGVVFQGKVKLAIRAHVPVDLSDLTEV